MAAPVGLVGVGAANAPGDVTTIKQLLNAYATRLNIPPLAGTNDVDAATINAIKALQQNYLGMRQPDGVIEARSSTIALLAGADSTGVPARLSGIDWFRANEAKYPNSSSLDQLAPAFSAKVRDFITALRDAGAHVSISATRRNKDRAFIMHWAWLIAHDKAKAAAVPANKNVDIIWDHASAKASKASAQEMVKAFAIAFQPSLTSRHIDGLAIDMTISWTGPIEVTDHDGDDIAVDKPRSGARNDTLHEIGASYGVVKLLSDPPHWSSDGH